MKHEIEACSRSGRGRHRGPRRIGLLVLLLGSPALLAGAQETGPPEAPPSIEEAQRAADRAEAAAAQARNLLERLEADERAAAAEEAAAKEAAAAPEPSPRVVLGEKQSRSVDEAITQANEAAREAEAAAREARSVANEVRDAMREYQHRFARTGPYIGIAGTYLLEDFDTRLDVSNGRGAAALLGYRVHRHVAIELRGEYFNGIDVQPDGSEASALDLEVDGYLVTVGPKFYPLTKSLQPFVGVGFGVIRTEIEGTSSSGVPVDDGSTDSVFRIAGGIDYFLSENLVLNLEAAYISPGDGAEGLDFGNLSAGLSFRF